MQSKTLIVAFFALTATFAAQAQAGNAYSAFESKTTIQDAGDAIYADAENDLYFVDFESLSVILDNIVITNESGKVVLEKKVFDLPVDTIYELDLSEYANGRYNIDLRSFTGTLRKEITLK